GGSQRLTAYWERQLHGAPAVSGLPLDRPRPRIAGTRGIELTCRLPALAASRLEEVAGSLRLTGFTPQLAAFAALVLRWSGGDETIVAVPAVAREEAEEHVVGCFMNTLPIRVTVAERQTFASLARRVGSTLMDALTHQDLPLEAILQRLP